MDFKINLLDRFSPSFLGQKWYFLLQIPFEGKTNSLDVSNEYII